MVFVLVKLNYDFMIGKANSLRPSLKTTIERLSNTLRQTANSKNETFAVCLQGWVVQSPIKVPITPKYCLNKSLHLFEMHCAFLN